MSKTYASGSRLERKTQHNTLHDPEECVQCRLYANHLEGPLLVVTEPYSDLFRDGEYQGRVLQQEEDSRLLKQYRHQLQQSQRQYEESVLTQEKFRDRIAMMEAEVALLKDQLIAVQMAYDDVTLPEGVGGVGILSAQGEGSVEVEDSARTTEDHAPRAQNTHLESQMEVGNSRFDAADYVSKHEHFNQILRGLRIAEGRGIRNMDIDADVDQYSITSDTDNEGIRSPITVSSASSSNVPSRSQSVAPQPRGEAQELTLREIYFLLATAFASGGEEARDRIALLLEDAEQTPLSSRTDAQRFLLRCRNEGRLGFLESHTAASTSRPHSHSELTIDQVISLMAEAAGHSEGETLEKVNFLFEEAHKTPESMRTPVQLYLLRYWRRPSHLPPTLIPPLSVSPLNHRPITLNLESDTPSAEIFVDASWFGVGFVTNDDRWLAWTFRRGHPEIPQGPDGRIVMSWAEIIAAELGIRTLIAAGYNKTTIMLRSDNFGVVMALYTRRWTSNYGVNEILKRILRLCMSAGLVVMPVWVPSGSNPADGPSRGLYPPSRLKFGYAPEIPLFLQSFISQV